jgi:putative ABC transport system substrate-binding protein
MNEPLHLNRRQLLQGIAVLGLSSATGLLSEGCASSQPTAKKLPRIGVLSLASDDSVLEPFRQGLRELGYVDGENIAVEYRYMRGDPALAPAYAAELVGLNIDALVAGGNVSTLAAKNATNKIPIVGVVLEEPAANGLVASLARPGGNVTGLTQVPAATHIHARRLELLKQTIPTAVRVAGLGVPTSDTTLWWSETQDAAQALGTQLVFVTTTGGNDLERAFDAALTQRVDGLLTGPQATLFSSRAKIAELALRKHVPAMFGEREYVDAGGLMNYGPSFSEMWRRAAAYVDKILKGAKPADLPIEQPARIDFVINLRTATALGLTIPQSVVSQATELLR